MMAGAKACSTTPDIKSNARPPKLIVALTDSEAWVGEVYRTQGGKKRVQFAGYAEFVQAASSLLPNRTGESSPSNVVRAGERWR